MTRPVSLATASVEPTRRGVAHARRAPILPAATQPPNTLIDNRGRAGWRASGCPEAHARLTAVFLKQAQLDKLGDLGKDRGVRPDASVGRAERKRRAGPQPHHDPTSMRARFPRVVARAPGSRATGAERTPPTTSSPTGLASPRSPLRIHVLAASAST